MTRIREEEEDCCVTHFHLPQLFAVAATLKSIDYNVAMTFILNNNNNLINGSIYNEKQIGTYTRPTQQCHFE